MQQVLLTANEIGEMLRIKPARVYELVREGILPCVRLGRQIRFDQQRLRDWIEPEVKGSLVAGDTIPTPSSRDSGKGAEMTESLAANHLALIEGSAIGLATATERGYRTDNQEGRVGQAGLLNESTDRTGVTHTCLWSRWGRLRPTNCARIPSDQGQ